MPIVITSQVSAQHLASEFTTLNKLTELLNIVNMALLNTWAFISMRFKTNKVAYIITLYLKPSIVSCLNF